MEQISAPQSKIWDLVDFFRKREDRCEELLSLHLEILLKAYESVTDIALKSIRSDELSLLWSMARLNYLEHRMWLYKLSGTFPPTSTFIPTHVCDRVAMTGGRHNSGRTNWIVPMNGVNPNTLYHLDWMFKI